MTTSDDVITAARRIANVATYGFFTTAADGIQTRMVQHLEVTDDCGITFSTGPATRKAVSVRADSSVSYAVYDPETRAAASINGVAHLDTDLGRRLALWDDSLAPFFPEGPDGDGFVLVTIVATQVEVWSMPDELAPPPFGLSSATSHRVNDSWSEATGTHPAGRAGDRTGDG